MDLTGPWVSVVYLDADEMVDATSRYGLAKYLAGWDYGQETDDAATRPVPSWGTHDRLTEHEVGGLTYVLATNHALGYVSLSRRPLA